MSAAETMITPPPAEAPKVAWALFVAAMGLPVHPLHNVRDDGQCSCAKTEPHKFGKHPREVGWQSKATTNAEAIRAWWKRWPSANVGIATDGFVVLDPDGQEGLASLASLKLDLPATFTVRTGGGGLHLYFTRPEGIVTKNWTSKLGPNLDVRTDGGNLVGPVCNANLTRVPHKGRERSDSGRLSGACGARYRNGMVNRSRNLVVRVADDELEMMHAIATEERETAATLVRRWIRQHFAARFGETATKTRGSKR